MKTRLEVQLTQNPYSVFIGHPVDDLASIIAERFPFHRFLVVTDSHVAPLYANIALRSLRHHGFDAEIEIVPAGELSKTLGQVSRIIDRLVELGADRQTCVVAAGGGMIGDLAGFAAAIFARGIPVVQLPTSLLAMIDSSIGGKTGVNHPLAKNLIGAFHQPAMVLIDPACLRTLPANEFRQGIAEAIKYGAALDATFLTFLKENSTAILEREPGAIFTLIETCCRLKADIVAKDEREITGLRAKLNFGHTFAHAFETCSHHQISHGDAVAVGMICASMLAQKLAMIDNASTVIRSLLDSFQIPDRLPLKLSMDEIMKAMKRDKKAARSQFRFVLPKELGNVELLTVEDENAIRESIEAVMG